MMEEHLVKVEKGLLKKVVEEVLLKMVVVEGFLKKVGDPLMMEVVVMTYLSLKNFGLIPYFDQMMVEEISSLIVSYCY